MYLYASRINMYDNCPHSFALKYKHGIRSAVLSSNLFFGKIVHEVIEQIIRSIEEGISFDAVNKFEELWDKVVATESITYSSIWNSEALKETGKHLCQEFSEQWATYNLSPLIDEDGNLLLEKEYIVEINGQIKLAAILDFAGVDEDGNVIVLDFKTPAALGPEEHLKNDDQLKIQQMVLEANKHQFGIEKISKIGFMELNKKKMPKPLKSGKFGKNASWPKVHDPKLKPAFSDEEISEFRQKIVWMVEDIDRGRFPKRPRQAYNTPCTMCDFSGYCTEGSKEDLIFPEDQQQKLAV